jgi:bifunctional non-homologous end joining protein LigD
MRWRDDPAAVRPMLASLEEPPIVQAGLFYEPKYDGIRALIDVRPGRGRRDPAHVAIYSRNGIEKTAQFPAVADALAAIASSLGGPVLLDGELVAVDAKGQPLGFQHIQGRIHLTSPPDIARAEAQQPVVLVIFDLLRDADDDLRGEPFASRRLTLQKRVRIPAKLRGVLRLSEIVADDGRPLLERAKKEGGEGLIAKQGGSVYHSGRRSPAWRKLKLLKQQEFVVGGWTEPRQTRSHFGSLLLGYYDDEGKLRWAGSVGTGLNQAELDRVATLLGPREAQKSPFDDRFKTMEKAHWVKPDLVVQVRFTEWTAEGLLRHPVYLGLRADKKARDVRREEASKPATPRLTPRSPYRKNRRLEPQSGKIDSRSRPSHETPGVSQPDSRSRFSHETPGIGKSDSRSQRDRQTPGIDSSSPVVAQLQALEDARKDGELRLPNGDTLRVTNLRKLFWPKLGITKGELLRYYAAVAPFLLPAVDDRPLVMKRFPNGVDSHAFYQQRHPETPPPGVRREVLPEEAEPIDEEGPRDRIIGGSLTTLLYVTQLAAISQDPWFSRVADPLHADYVAIDLDPGDEATFAHVLDVARWCKEEMDRLGIPGVPKTSGSSGLHIYVPLPKKTTYETGQMICQIVATLVATKHPKVATVERMVRRRPRGTVYVDYLQNILGKTIATAYSARASDYAGVSTPLTWDEVASGVDPRDFTIRTALDRFRSTGDLWAALRTIKPVDIQRLVRRAKV